MLLDKEHASGVPLSVLERKKIVRRVWWVDGQCKVLKWLWVGMNQYCTPEADLRVLLQIWIRERNAHILTMLVQRLSGGLRRAHSCPGNAGCSSQETVWLVLKQRVAFQPSSAKCPPEAQGSEFWEEGHGVVQDGRKKENRNLVSFSPQKADTEMD